MKIGEAIKKADELYRNTYTEEQKTEWLAEFDEKILREEYATHEELCDLATTDWIKFIMSKFAPLYIELGIDIPDAEDIKVTLETELLIPMQYQEIYVLYLLYKMCFYSAEYERANNYAAEYIGLYNSFRNYINRKYMPLTKATIKV